MSGPMAKQKIVLQGGEHGQRMSEDAFTDSLSTHRSNWAEYHWKVCSENQGDSKWPIPSRDHKESRKEQKKSESSFLGTQSSRTTVRGSGPLVWSESCSVRLCDPLDYTVHGILQARILEWVAFPFSRGSSQPRDQTQVSHIAGRFFTIWTTRKPT